VIGTPREVEVEGGVHAGFEPVCFGPDHVPFMYLDPWMRTGHRQNYALSVSGGTDAVRYYASGQFRGTRGVIPREKEDRVSARGNFSIRPLDNLHIDWNTAFATTEVQNVAGGNNGNAITVSNELWKEMQRADPKLDSPTPPQPHVASTQKKAAVTPARFLRPLHASMLIAAGADPKYVADRLGHSNASFTLEFWKGRIC
jgi:hypothetical protein